MGNENASPNECYECGAGPDDLRYRSLKPLKPHWTEYDTDGKPIISRGFNGDYNVCAPCYIAQFKELYPDVEVPARALAGIKHAPEGE
jgi:hypothetical protein